MLVMVVFFIAFRWIHLSTPLIRLFLLVLILLLMPTLNFLPVWFALSLLRFRLPSRLPMMFILWMVARSEERRVGKVWRSVSAFLLNRSSDLLTVNAGNGGFLHCIQMDTSVNAANQVVSVGADIAFDADPKFFACLVRFESSSVPTTLPTAYDVYPLDGR